MRNIAPPQQRYWKERYAEMLENATETGYSAGVTSAPDYRDGDWFFRGWTVELVPDYQGQPHLVGAEIATDACMIAEISGAVEVDGRPHDLHRRAAYLIAAAPDLLDALERIAGMLCGDSMSQQDRRDAYAIADAALAKATPPPADGEG